jgi:low affinity Fe/Cu permease
MVTRRPGGDHSSMASHSGFPAFARGLSAWTGRASTFAFAVGLVLAWALTGPIFGYSDTWQLVINTATTVVTFLMVFLIQNTQNRDTQAMQIKLDEIIRATQGTHNAILDLEEMDEEELARQHARYLALAKQAREALKRGGQDVDTPPVEAARDGLRRAG